MPCSVGNHFKRSVQHLGKEHTYSSQYSNRDCIIWCTLLSVNLLYECAQSVCKFYTLDRDFTHPGWVHVYRRKTMNSQFFVVVVVVFKKTDRLDIYSVQNVWKYRNWYKPSFFCESQWTGNIDYFQMDGRSRIDWAVRFQLYNQRTTTAACSWTCSAPRESPTAVVFVAQCHFLNILITFELWPLGSSLLWCFVISVTTLHSL